MERYERHLVLAALLSEHQGSEIADLRHRLQELLIGEAHPIIAETFRFNRQYRRSEELDKTVTELVVFGAMRDCGGGFYHLHNLRSAVTQARATLPHEKFKYLREIGWRI